MVDLNFGLDWTGFGICHQMNNFNAIECVTHKRTKIKSRLPQTQNQNHSCISIETKFIVCNMSEFSFENLMSDSCVFSQPNATIFLRKKSQQKRNKLVFDTSKPCRKKGRIANGNGNTFWNRWNIWILLAVKWAQETNTGT